MKTPALLIVILLCTMSLHHSQAQVRVGTVEDSLAAGLSPASSTVLGGYGNAVFRYDRNEEASRMTLERFVLFVGHTFTPVISVFSELEVEDAKVAGGESGGEVALEQAYLKFDLGRNNSLLAGLFIPRIGILNENHLPTSFNGNERTLVETFVIPSTWRELGVGWHGAFDRLPLDYTFAVMNGLSAARFEHGSGIRGGRFEGSNASANSLAFTGSLQLHQDRLAVQLSGYIGGASAVTKREADSLHLASGVLGTTVILGEADVRYEDGGFAAKALGTVVSIPDAEAVNSAYGNNTPQRMFGAYAEVGYDLLRLGGTASTRQLIAFARLEVVNLNAALPANGVPDGTLEQRHLLIGLTYLPTPNVVIKADLRVFRSGEVNPSLAGVEAQAYRRSNAFLNAGIGFSF